MNPSRRGDETEAILLARLLEMGCSVAMPFGDSDRYDLLVDDDGYLFRVQCKTGSWVNGTVRFRLYSSTVVDGEHVDTDYTAEEVDAFAVYSPETDEAYWVPIDETGTGEMRLRVDDPRPKAPRSRLNWASEYLLSARFG